MFPSPMLLQLFLLLRTIAELFVAAAGLFAEIRQRIAAYAQPQKEDSDEGWPHA